MKYYSIPEDIEHWIDLQLKQITSSLSQPKQLAQAIKQMADFYKDNPQTPTPWSEPWCQQAQLAYYFPLNFLRNIRVFNELQSLHFFQESFSWYEIGTGLGPSLEAFLHIQSSSPIKPLSIHLLETSKQAKSIYQERLQNHPGLNPQWMNQIPKSLPPKSLLIMSYSLTEFDNIPEWIWTADSIIIIEPSTRDNGRKLMQLRAEAFNKGFQVIAPCTHNHPCPLLTHSQKDWCHDRFGFERPAWMLAIENHLPFKNHTLTLSYLALKRQTQASKDKNGLVSQNSTTLTPKNQARVIGDFLNEKGKTRQLICRDSEREFISFIKKSETPIEFFRGDLITLSDAIEKKGDELRPTPSQIKSNEI